MLRQKIRQTLIVSRRKVGLNSCAERYDSYFIDDNRILELN